MDAFLFIFFMIGYLQKISYDIIMIEKEENAIIKWR